MSVRVCIAASDVAGVLMAGVAPADADVFVGVHVPLTPRLSNLVPH